LKLPYINLPEFGFGVTGAAIATIIFQSVAFIIGFIILFSGAKNIKPSLKGLFRLSCEIDKKLITVGLPNRFKVFMRQLSAVMILYFASKYGTNAISAYTIGGRIFGFVFMPFFGLLMGGSAIIGQTLGAEKLAKVSGGMKTIITGLFLFILVAFSPELIALFSANRMVIENGTLLLRYSTLGLLFCHMGLE